MNSILDFGSGWLGYLERVPVVTQILVAVLPVLVISLGSRRLPADAWFRRQHRLWSLALVGLGTAVLGLLGQRIGLAVYLGALYGWWVLIDWLRRWLAPRTDAHLLKQVDSGLVRPIFLVLAVLGLIRKIDNLDELALAPIGMWFGATVNVGQIFSGLVILYLLITGSGPFALLLALMLGRLLNLSEGSRRALTLIIRYAVVAIGLVWALDHIGFNRTAIVAIAGGLSVGVGFGVKEVVANFVSGLWLLVEGSVRPGEVLLFDGDHCEVRKLGLRAALLWRDRDNTELLIPNQLFFSATTTTFTGSDGMRRCQVEVSAAYRHRPREVMHLLVQTTATVPEVLAQPAPLGLILHYGESGVDYAVRFWIANPMQATVVSSAVREAIWEAFAAEGIEIPFPQRVLHQA